MSPAEVADAPGLFGVPNFFAVFIRVLEVGGSRLEVEPGVTVGDYLHSFVLGTHVALDDNGRESTLSMRRLSAL
jgi:glucose-6-phosphate isomerase